MGIGRSVISGAIAFVLVCGAAVAPAMSQIAITGESAPPPSAPAESSQSHDAPNAAAHSAGADMQLAEAADKYKHAVGVVVAGIPGYGPVPIGTAWAFEDRYFATNSHVISGIQEYAEQFPGTSFFVAINQRPDKRLKIVAYRKHPRYGISETSYDGKQSLGGYDIGILRTETAAPTHFKLADAGKLKSLRAGVRIAYLGFPMETLVDNNLNTQMPIATMQSGIVTAVSDAFMGDSGYEKNRLIRHNLPSAGGASGSPIFLADGSVVAIHWGGNNIMRIVPNAQGKLDLERAPNAALVNFAERIDSLSGVPRP